MGEQAVAAPNPAKMGGTWRTEVLIEHLRAERKRQDAKWGAERDLSDGEWLKIIVEELGEVAKASLEREGHEARIEELVQVAAVALAWADNVLRNWPAEPLAARGALDESEDK